MNDEQTPDIEELKEQEKIEIPVDEDSEDLKTEQALDHDIVEELKNLGRQVAETIESAWNSEERVRIEGEVREGVKSFVDEVDKVIREAKSSPAAEKMKHETVGMKDKVETSDISQKARTGLVQGLRWLSEELGHLADQFTEPAPAEKAPEDVADSADVEEINVVDEVEMESPAPDPEPQPSDDQA